jgi:hypothetical protein
MQATDFRNRLQAPFYGALIQVVKLSSGSFLLAGGRRFDGGAAGEVGVAKPRKVRVAGQEPWILEQLTACRVGIRLLCGA